MGQVYISKPSTEAETQVNLHLKFNYKIKAWSWQSIRVLYNPNKCIGLQDKLKKPKQGPKIV